MIELSSAIESIKVHTFKPGDVLMVKVPQHTSKEEAELIQRGIKSILPLEVKCMLMTGDIEVEVISPTEEEHY